MQFLFTDLIGQPVCITTEGGSINGTVLDVGDDYVRIITSCQQIFVVSFEEIDFFQQPTMVL